MARLTWARLASDDLAQACERIGKDSPAAARHFARKIMRAVERLRRFPRSGRVVPEFRRPELRELIVAQRRVVYRLSDDSVEIAAIVHARRRLAPLLARRRSLRRHS